MDGLKVLKKDKEKQMEKLTVEQWNDLDVAEKEARAEEMPEELTTPNKEPTAAELKQQLADTNKRIAELEESHKRETGGLAFDLKQERQKRQELEQRLKGKGSGEEEDPLKDKADDEFITAKDLKLLQTRQEIQAKKERQAMLQERMDERMDTDEERMVKLTAPDKDGKQPEEYPVTFAEAAKAFEKIAGNDKSLWEDIFREALRPRGRPAEKLYRIVLLQDANLSKLITQKTREKIVQEITNKPKTPTKLGGGGGGKGEIDLTNIGDKELLEAVKNSPDAVDKALGKT